VTVVSKLIFLSAVFTFCLLFCFTYICYSYFSCLAFLFSMCYYHFLSVILIFYLLCLLSVWLSFILIFCELFIFSAYYSYFLSPILIFCILFLLQSAIHILRLLYLISVWYSNFYLLLYSTFCWLFLFSNFDCSITILTLHISTRLEKKGSAMHVHQKVIIDVIDVDVMLLLLISNWFILFKYLQSRVPDYLSS
jgi:hypothetical protein